MSAEAGAPPLATRRPSLSLASRLYGFGSIYGKTIRDSRLTFLIVTGLTAGLLFVVGAGVASAFATPAARHEISDLVKSLPPILAGIAGKPVNLETLGGYIAYKYGPLFAVIAALWSILALSSTLAGEARRGSLDLVAATPFGKRRVALEKLAAHVTLMTLAMAILAVAAWATGAVFGILPGDAISVESAIGFALWVGLIGLVSGSVAFALSPIVGRASAAGVASAVLLAGYVLNGYSDSVPAFSAVANLTWFHWTSDHLPLSGQYDWASLLLVAIVTAILFGLGVEAFGRRDIGAMSAIHTPGLPPATLGVRGPVRRVFGDQLPLAITWGIGFAIWGFIIAASSRSFADGLSQTSPDLLKTFHAIFPNFDMTSAGGFLQLLFIQLGFIVVGFAAATMVARWASDEGAGRLEVLLATPLARARWVFASGMGMILAIVVLTGIAAAGIGIGALAAGSDPGTPVAGTLALGLYAAALAGIGIGVGGLFRTSIAAEAVALVVTATFLIDLLAPALQLPGWVHQIALTAHLGQPMIGIWDLAGVVACLVLAGLGTAVGAWGMTRRDVAA
jgi:ABC-2 type transport system permease protein